MERTPESSSLDDSNSTDIKPVSTQTTAVAVLGTGLYGRALAARLRSRPAFNVRVGSRSNQEGTMSPAQAVAGAQVVFLAVPAHAHEAVMAAVGPHMERGAVLVDMSNHALSTPPPAQGLGSLAERLRTFVPPHVSVVKAFNTLSSYHVEPTGVCKTLPLVHIAADDLAAVDTLSRVVADMGFVAVHHGPLSSAGELERSSHGLFPTWRSSFYLSTLVLSWWILYITLSGYVFRRIDTRKPGQLSKVKWDKYPQRVFMASTAQTAMTLFALTFLPGPIASIVQIVRGNASKPFGRKFGAWLDMRKELGVTAFFFASLHACIGAISGSHLNDGWKGGMYFVLGTISYALFALLAISSTRSVSDHMSWAEFRAVFSWVGVGALVLGVAHQGMYVSHQSCLRSILLCFVPFLTFVNFISRFPLSQVGMDYTQAQTDSQNMGWSRCYFAPGMAWNHSAIDCHRAQGCYLESLCCLSSSKASQRVCCGC